MCVLTKQAYAYVHYFESEGVPVVQNISNKRTNLKDGRMSIFYTNTDKEEVVIENRSIIDIEKAIEIVKEFYSSKALPKCVEWEEGIKLNPPK